MASTKRTPYDVWKERNPDKLKEMYTVQQLATRGWCCCDDSVHIFGGEKSQAPALTEAQWNQLVNHLHETNKRKETYATDNATSRSLMHGRLRRLIRRVLRG